jgi:hypothetical protein
MGAFAAIPFMVLAGGAAKDAHKGLGYDSFTCAEQGLKPHSQQS